MMLSTITLARKITQTGNTVTELAILYNQQKN